MTPTSLFRLDRALRDKLKAMNASFSVTRHADGIHLHVGAPHRTPPATILALVKGFYPEAHYATVDHGDCISVRLGANT